MFWVSQLNPKETDELKDPTEKQGEKHFPTGELEAEEPKHSEEATFFVSRQLAEKLAGKEQGPAQPKDTAERIRTSHSPPFSDVLRPEGEQRENERQTFPRHERQKGESPSRGLSLAAALKTKAVIPTRGTDLPLFFMTEALKSVTQSLRVPQVEQISRESVIPSPSEEKANNRAAHPYATWFLGKFRQTLLRLPSWLHRARVRTRDSDPTDGKV